MKLLGDVGYVKSRFSQFVDSVSVSTRLVHCLREMNHRLINHFGRT
jgi:hypothetical protein